MRALVPFLRTLPNGYKVEIRNRAWLDAELADLFRHYKIALVLQDRSWMPSPSELKFDPITADWTYIRWLGDRKAIEEQTVTWDKTVIDRTEKLTSWVDFCYQIRKRGVVIYAMRIIISPGTVLRRLNGSGTSGRPKAIPLYRRRACSVHSSRPHFSRKFC